MTICAITECARPARTRGWCTTHYARFLRHGSPTVTTRIRLSPGASTEDRFWSKVSEGTSGCWEWVGAITSRGYGNFRAEDHNVPAHRWSYERLRTEIPAGLDLDHLCRNRVCVNPWHLEPVTRKVNSLRGMSPTILTHLRRKAAS